MIVIENNYKRHYFPSPDHIAVTCKGKKLIIEIDSRDKSEHIEHEYKDVKTAEIAKTIVCRQLERCWDNYIIINFNLVQSDE